MPAQGTLSLYIRDQKVGAGRIRTQPGQVRPRRRRAGSRALRCRAGDGWLRRPARRGGSSAGTIMRVLVDVSGQPFVDLAREAAAAFARQ